MQNLKSHLIRTKSKYLKIVCDVRIRVWAVDWKLGFV